VFYALSRVPTLSAENRVRWGPPYWKVPPEEFAVACAVAERSPVGAWVLAPVEVAPWITTLHQHPRPLVVRPDLLLLGEGQLGTEEVRRRLLLASIVSGLHRTGQDARLLGAGIEDYQLAALSIAGEASTAEIRSVLRDRGLNKVASSPTYEIWATRGKLRDYRGSQGCREYVRELGLE